MNETMIWNDVSGFGNSTLRITTAAYEPFVWWETDNDGKTVYYGLVVSLMQTLAQHLNFSIAWQPSSDLGFGSTNSTGHWTGAVGDVLYGRADIAATGLTISLAREEVIDFSVAYWEEPMGVLVKSNQESKLLAPVRPFSGTLWLCILVALLVVSSTMSALAWTQRALRVRYGQSGAGVRAPYGLKGGVWSVIVANLDRCFRAFVGQAVALPVTSQSLRYVFGTWLFAYIVLYASYTAKLTAELTVSVQRAPFQTLHEATEQDTYKFGVREGTITHLILKTAPPGSVYNKMSQKVQTFPIEANHCETIKSGNLALVSDETLLLMCAKDDCDSIIINERFYKSGFGLAFPQNWPYKKHFDNAMQRILEAGLVEQWKKQWFPQFQCQRGAFVEARSISLGDTVGVFLLLGLGIALALCAIVLEHFYSVFLGEVIYTIKP